MGDIPQGYYKWGGEKKKQRLALKVRQLFRLCVVLQHMNYLSMDAMLHNSCFREALKLILLEQLWQFHLPAVPLAETKIHVHSALFKLTLCSCACTLDCKRHVATDTQGREYSLTRSWSQGSVCGYKKLELMINRNRVVQMERTGSGIVK